MRRLEKNGTNRVTRDSRAMEFDLNKSLRRSADSLSLSSCCSILLERTVYVRGLFSCTVVIGDIFFFLF